MNEFSIARLGSYSSKTLSEGIGLSLIKSSLSKPFVILTGASGTGKTKLATQLCKRLNIGSCPDPLSAGTVIKAPRAEYRIVHTDRLSIEFWNRPVESEAIRVLLPRDLISEWVTAIIQNGFDSKTSTKDIKQAALTNSRYSPYLHSFDTHLKAAALYLIDKRKNSPGTEESLPNYEIVAVGADWTDNRNVLGFVNHLNTDGAGPRYQSTPILDLLLRAKDDPDVPYFLVLDEMNLSHVERYFADFLSAMEQKNGPLKLHSENGKLRRSGQSEADVPPELDYPDNLFVIGTVNIDETTYMFSPKVLDRANVIEFTVSKEEIAAFLKEPKAYPEIEPAEPGVAEGFLQLAKQAREMGCAKLPEESAAKISDHLIDLFRILKAERFEFAYRTAKEINIYLQVCRHLAEDKSAWDSGEWRGDLDGQILQKLLPKLHGSIGRIGKLLARLAHYCQSGELKADAPTQLDAAAQLEKIDTTPFPKSLAKLQSMIGTLKEEQFVSFIQ